MDNRISDFINEHFVLTMASSSQEDIWCANVFYVFDQELMGFIILSDKGTRHIKLSQYGFGVVAGSIVLETEKIGMIRGLQFKAHINRGDNSIIGRYRLKYLKRFPYAVFTNSELWFLSLIEVKYTDNRLGFGTKLIEKY